MTKLTIKNSRRHMGKAIRRLQYKLSATPEYEFKLRDNIIRKIEMLKIIRIEMKELLNQL